MKFKQKLFMPFTHPYHIVDPSPWPLLVSFGALFLTTGMVMYMHTFSFGVLLFWIGFLIILYIMYLWWSDVVSESTFLGYHTKFVQMGLKIGFVLFMVSEIMFFFSFFWSFFHSSLSPAMEMGSIWPPLGMKVFNVWEVPLLNTLMLLLSGATVTWAHYNMLLNDYEEVIMSFSLTLFLALLFTVLQLVEYITASFGISDGMYGSTFFMLTGFHGFHVIIGTLFLFICFLSFLNYNFSINSHLGFEAAAWYWHFVDVVWLFLLISLYWWGNWI